MGSLTTCWELDYLLERLTNLHVTRPQVHLQGSPQQPTHVTKGPVCIHLFQVLFEILNRDILRSTMRAKMLSPKFRADSLEGEIGQISSIHLICTSCTLLSWRRCMQYVPFATP